MATRTFTVNGVMGTIFDGSNNYDGQLDNGSPKAYKNGILTGSLCQWSTSDKAQQGRYMRYKNPNLTLPSSILDQSSSFCGYRTGVIHFPNLRANVMGASISKVVLTIKFGTSGLASQKNEWYPSTPYNYDKLVGLYCSKVNGIDTTITTNIKNSYLGTFIQNLDGNAGYGNTESYTFTSGTVITQLANGMDTFCIYNASTGSHRADWSDNSSTNYYIGYIGDHYLSITSVSIKVTYRLPIVYISDGTKYVRAIPWVSNGTKYVRAIPYASNGTTYKKGVFEPSS